MNISGLFFWIGVCVAVVSFCYLTKSDGLAKKKEYAEESRLLRNALLSAIFSILLMTISLHT